MYLNQSNLWGKIILQMFRMNVTMKPAASLGQISSKIKAECYFY